MQYPGKRSATPLRRATGATDAGCRRLCHAETKGRSSLLVKASEADSFQVPVDAVAVVTDTGVLYDSVVPHGDGACAPTESDVVFRSQVLVPEFFDERVAVGPVHT